MNTEELLSEIKNTLDNNPDQTLLELIDRVIRFTHPTLSYYIEKPNEEHKWYLSALPPKYRLTNTDLYNSFKKFNKMRKHDKRTID